MLHRDRPLLDLQLVPDLDLVENLVEGVVGVMEIGLEEAFFASVRFYWQVWVAEEHLQLAVLLLKPITTTTTITNRSFITILISLPLEEW